MKVFKCSTLVTYILVFCVYPVTSYPVGAKDKDNGSKATRQHKNIHKTADKLMDSPTSTRENLTSLPISADVITNGVPGEHFISPSTILDRVYWIDSVRNLFYRLYLAVKKTREASPTLALDVVRDTARRQAWTLEGELYHLTEEQLVELFWALHRFIQNGLVSEDGSVVIDGREYNLNDLVTSCCSFG